MNIEQVNCQSLVLKTKKFFIVLTFLQKTDWPTSENFFNDRWSKGASDGTAWADKN